MLRPVPYREMEAPGPIPGKPARDFISTDVIGDVA